MRRNFFIDLLTHEANAWRTRLPGIVKHFFGRITGKEIGYMGVAFGRLVFVLVPHDYCPAESNVEGCSSLRIRCRSHVTRVLLSTRLPDTLRETVVGMWNAFYERSSSIMESGHRCPWRKGGALKPTGSTTRAMGTPDIGASLFIAGRAASIRDGYDSHPWTCGKGA